MAAGWSQVTLPSGVYFLFMICYHALCSGTNKQPVTALGFKAVLGVRTQLAWSGVLCSSLMTRGDGSRDRDRCLRTGGRSRAIGVRQGRLLSELSILY
jgi:hypothetical protein